MINKLRATLVAAGCTAAVAAVPATSIAATPHSLCGNTAYSVCQHAKPKLKSSTATGWRKGKFSFAFKVVRRSSTDYGLKSVTVTLPKGVSFNKKTYAKDVSVGSVKHTFKLNKNGTLTVTVKSPVNGIAFTSKSGAFKETRAVRRDKKLTVGLAVTDSAHKTYKVSYTA